MPNDVAIIPVSNVPQDLKYGTNRMILFKIIQELKKNFSIRKKNKYTYKNVISLGCFCFVASELRRIDLREKAYPFDWIISNFQDVLLLIEQHFKDFLNQQYFEYQQEKEVFVVKNTKYKLVHFVHDFISDKPIDTQINNVKDKYERRITRFYHDITQPTLFIRYIFDKAEYQYIKENKMKILAILKSYNQDNDIIFILNDHIKKTNKKSFYNVKKNKNENVSQEFLKKNKQLNNYLTQLKKRIVND